MRRGFSIHFGASLPAVCDNRTKLNGPPNDVNALADLAKSRGFQQVGSFPGQVNVGDVKDAFKDILARNLVRDDILLVTYSGHSSQIRDQPPIDEPYDGVDEEWCLSDNVLRDDVIDDYLAKFGEGVRIVMVTDSCHSGSAFLLRENGVTHPAGPLELLWLDAYFEARRRLRVLARVLAGVPRDLAELEMLRNPSSKRIVARVLLLAACRERENAADGDPHGAFTEKLISRLYSAKPPKTYADLIKKVRSDVSGEHSHQHPSWAYDATLLAEEPFTI